MANEIPIVPLVVIVPPVNGALVVIDVTVPVPPNAVYGTFTLQYPPHPGCKATIHVELPGLTSGNEDNFCSCAVAGVDKNTKIMSIYLMWQM